MITLDDTDLKLVNLLSKDGRMAGIEISKLLEISPSTVARKIKRLEEAGVIKGYLAIIDDELIGNRAGSALTIKLDGGTDANEILDILVQNEDVCNVFETLGNYDILITCCNNNESKVYDCVKDIKSMEGVTSVDFASIVSRRKILKKSL